MNQTDTRYRTWQISTRTNTHFSVLTESFPLKQKFETPHTITDPIKTKQF